METSDSIVNDESFLDRLYYLSFVPIAIGIEILPKASLWEKFISENYFLAATINPSADGNYKTITPIYQVRFNY